MRCSLAEAHSLLWVYPSQSPEHFLLCIQNQQSSQTKWNQSIGWKILTIRHLHMQCAVLRYHNIRRSHVDWQMHRLQPENDASVSDTWWRFCLLYGSLPCAVQWHTADQHGCRRPLCPGRHTPCVWHHRYWFGACGRRRWPLSPHAVKKRSDYNTSWLFRLPQVHFIGTSS